MKSKARKNMVTMGCAASLSLSIMGVGGAATAATLTFPGQGDLVIDGGDVGKLDVGDIWRNEEDYAPSTVFSDTYNFTLGTTAIGLGSTLLNVQLFNLENISNLTWTLHDGFNAAGPQLDTGGTGINQITLGLASDADYSYVVTGTVSGSLRGVYEMTMTALVPIPPAVLLFGSGLIGLAVIARRRQQSSGTEQQALSS